MIRKFFFNCGRYKAKRSNIAISLKITKIEKNLPTVSDEVMELKIMRKHS